MLLLRHVASEKFLLQALTTTLLSAAYIATDVTAAWRRMCPGELIDRQVVDVSLSSTVSS